MAGPSPLLEDLDVDIIADECQDSQCIPDGMEEVVDCCMSSSGAEADFDRMVGALEDIITDADFEEAQTSFCAAHCAVFEDSDENKLEYMELFQQYVDVLDGVIAARLAEALPDLPLHDFLHQLSEHGEAEGDVFDFLMTLCDFQAFKDLMLSYKQQAAGAVPSLQLLVQPMPLLTDEDASGDARPDLDTHLQISPIRRQLAALT
ncbi:hypothetical protein KFL_001870070 [Klebsormidium nitens]|uniref:ADP-ribosylation factor-like protein 2-binding protein n=1 Tax=Klebsormidium nitens TaxID=105231 RepID=A0A1Y1I0E6_KLENI|nr:hypothetical protein KFL_001870070 [Klebsormidium nitens]|eukprot:GAQ84385.1 hypothetical protein KFL_001870070 [Klebsormidium nitens]